MLTNDEKNFYNLVSLLSKEYPLKGHIIMSAEKIKNGVKSKEVIAAIKQAGIQDLMAGNAYMTDDQKVKVICTYLSVWEKVVEFSFRATCRAVTLPIARQPKRIKTDGTGRKCSMRSVFSFTESYYSPFSVSFTYVEGDESYIVSDDIIYIPDNIEKLMNTVNMVLGVFGECVIDFEQEQKTIEQAN